MSRDFLKANKPTLVGGVVIPVPLVLPPETMLDIAIARMQETRTDYILVVETQRLLGVVTEQTLLGVAASASSVEETTLAAVTPSERMILKVAELGNTQAIAQKMQQSQIYHLPVVNDAGQLLGVVTHSSLLRTMSLASGEASDKQHSNRRATKSTRFQASSTIPYNSQERAIGTTSIGEDTTERAAFEKMKGEFISVVSHELRTPLTAIHGGLKLLAKGIVPIESARGQVLLRTVANTSKRLVRLVNNILELERMESGRSLLKKRSLNTKEITQSIAQSFAVESFEVVGNTPQDMTLVVSDPGIEIVADGDRLIQGLANLIQNAVKFSPEKSTIWLSAELQKTSTPKNKRDTVLFKVQDQGRGVPPEKHKMIFERFIQVDASDTRQEGGMGLGLSICRNIVEQHGGTIGIESTLGEGSCFYFTLPVAL